MTYYENQGIIAPIARGATLSDPDSPNFAGGWMSVTLNGATATDQVSVRNAEGIARVGDTITHHDVVIGTVTGGVNGTPFIISFNSAATPAAAEWLAKNLAYGSTSDALVDALLSFVITVNDGTGGQAQITSNLAVVGINDAPILSGLAANYDTFTAGDDPVRIDSGVPATLTDVDSSDFHAGGLKVSITHGRVQAEDLLGFAAGSGVSVVNDMLVVNGLTIGSVIQGKSGGSNDFYFLLNSSATPALVTHVIQSITYDNSNASPTAGLRMITVTVDDGDGENNGGTSMVSAMAQIEVGNAPPPPSITFGSTSTSDMVMDQDGTRIYEATHDGFVRAYDAGSGAVVANWDVGVRLGAIALAPSGSYLVAIERQELSEVPGISTTVAVHRVDTATGAVTTFPITLAGDGSAFWDVSVLSDGRVLLVGGDLGFPHVLDLFTGAVSVSTENFGPRPTVSTSSDLSQILVSVPDSSSAPLYLAGLDANNRLVTLDSTDLFSIPGASGLGHGAQAVSIEAGYVVQHAYGLYVWDLGLNYQFDLGFFGHSVVAEIAFDPDGEFLFVLDSEANQIKQVSLADYTVVRTIEVGADVVTNWELDSRFLTYANRLMMTDDLGRFSVATGHSIVRIDAAMPSLNLDGDQTSNMLTGSIGDDMLNGQGGADTMAGGHGDDVYIVDNVGDVIVDPVRKGMDSLLTTVSYTLGTGVSVERMFAYDGTAPINLTGNAFNQSITGNDGANILEGGGGADVMRGLNGDDVFIVDSTDDQVIELLAGGTDTIYTSVSYVLGGVEVEILSTRNHLGTEAITLVGNEFGQTLVGNAGANVLNGNGGADVMEGLAGDDTYVVDRLADQVLETVGGGNDTVFTNVSFVLSSLQEIETLTTQVHAGTENLFLTGNQLNNILIGNAGNNIMNGVAGADVMYGLAGDDTYAIDDAGDLVIDLVDQGNDLVYTYLSHTLSNGNQIETLSTVFHTGTEAINLGGNDYDNTLIGNNGANYINGGGGVDVMYGLGGDDTYVIENALDQIIEGAGGGSDTLFSFVSYVLAAGQQVEAMSTAGQGATTAINLTGNELGQIVVGNAGSNILDGKSGSDTLHGLGGADFFAFTTALGAGNVDTLADFSVVDDTIQLDDAVFAALGGLGTLNANAFVTGSAAADADDRILYNSATGALLYDADGTGGIAAVQFATLAAGLALTAGDFVVI